TSEVQPCIHQLGSEIKIRDPNNNETLFTYNAAHQLLTTTDPLGHTTTNTYNDAGTLTSVTNRNGMRIDYSYDAAGRVTQENWFDVNGNPVDTLTYNFD